MIFIVVQSEYSLNSTWTMKGLQMDAEKPKSFTTKTILSRRLEYVKIHHLSFSIQFFISLVNKSKKVSI
jgi:hypothetical protein